MNFRSRLSCSFGCLLLGFVSAGAVSAASYSGSFTSDDQMFETSLSLTGPSTVTAYTTSYASGGFVPVVSLFNQTTGAFIFSDGGDASCTNGRMKDATTGICNDAYLSQSVAKGNYLLVLTEFYNFPNGPDFVNGFSQAGNGNFTSSACPGTSGPFWETDLAPCVQRSGFFSLTTPSATTPEPATAWLTLPVIAFGIWRLKKTQSQTKSAARLEVN